MDKLLHDPIGTTLVAGWVLFGVALPITITTILLIAHGLNTWNQL